MTDKPKKDDFSERFIADGSGLTFDNSAAEGEPFDFTPVGDGEDGEDSADRDA